jgi:hypothetical protein
MINDWEYLPVAVRAWPGMRKTTGKQRHAPFPRKLLVIDTETTTDPTQVLTFGSAQIAWIAFGPDANLRFLDEPRVVEEIVFHADNLPDTDPEGFAILREYCETRKLKLLSQAEFTRQYLWEECFQRTNDKLPWPPSVMTFFNAPFDISHVAYDYGNGIGNNAGGFSFHMWPDGDVYNPRIVIKHLDSKKALISGANVLDLRTLIWAMTNKACTLERACKLFQLPDDYCKGHAEIHGVISPDYIDYNRQDVTATLHLAAAALKQFSEHPIALSPIKALSPASIVKSYLDAMGIIPILDRENVPDDPALLGYATSTFYGGRAECHIRKTPVPVTVLDFFSMYPTVNALLRLWDFITAKRITAEDATASVRELLGNVTPDSILDRSVWPELTGIAEVIPDGDILPVRAPYGADQNDVTNVGDNILHSHQPMWYALPDLVASKIRTGKTPEVVRAFRFIPNGKMPGLQPVKLAGTVGIDPVSEDFFIRVIEQRANIKTLCIYGNPDDCTCAHCRNVEFLKVSSNSGSYGIYVEMLHETTDTEGEQLIHGLFDEPWNHVGTSIETAQKWCYPPVGTLITSGARLMLAILEQMVTRLGGTWAFCDTDSMAIVTEQPNNDGMPPLPDDVKPLTSDQVEAIRQEINRLNPYSGDAGKTILKRERDCFAYVLSAKRYVLYQYESGTPVVPEKIGGKRTYMEHGLGLYHNPTDIESTDRKWMRQLWQHIVSQAHGIDAKPPEWIGQPALTQSAVTSPDLMRCFNDYNDGKNYRNRVKPFNFMLLVSEQRLLPALSEGVPKRFVTGYSRNPADWNTADWYNLHNPLNPPIKLSQIRVKTFRDVLMEYVRHPETKFLGTDGKPCNMHSTGLLSRRTVRVSAFKHIGKESNRLEEMQDGMIDSWDEVITDYGAPASVDPARHILSYWPARETAENINNRARQIRERMTDDPEISRMAVGFYGKPVTTSKTTINNWLHGDGVSTELARQLETLASILIAPLTGIPKHEINWGYPHNQYPPKKLLAIWYGMGCPGYDSEPLPPPDISKWNQAIEPRFCKCGCGELLHRANQKYAKKSCSEKMRRERCKHDQAQNEKAA